MNRRDRRRWAECRSLADVGLATIAWLNGEVKQTPGHLGPPCAETIPHIPVLRAVNAAGFVTENSQAAGSNGLGEWEAWVYGWVTDESFRLLDGVLEGTGLRVESYCCGTVHTGHLPGIRACPRADVDMFYAGRCPLAAAEMRAAWFVLVADPEPRNDERLWAALARFAEQA